MASPTVNIDSIISNLFNKFDDINKCILINNNKVTESLNTAKSYLCSEINQLYSKLNKIESEMSVLHDRIDCLERDKVNNDIVISGVPFIKNMSVHDIVMDICKAIAIPDGPNIVNDIFWVNHSNSRKSRRPTIVVKFINWHAKIRFFKNYVESNNLNLSHIGLQSTTRIFCNDGLTRINSAIFNSAKSLQKHNKISKVISKKGQIFVLILNHTTFLLIKSINQLNEVLAENLCKIQTHDDKLSNTNTVCNNIENTFMSPTQPILQTLPTSITSASTSRYNGGDENHRSTKTGNNTSLSTPQVCIVNNVNNENTFVPITQPILPSSVTSMTSKMDECISKLIEDCNSPVSSLAPPNKRNLRSQVYRTNSVTK